ncbi:MAG: cation diffusion facilitator family transporter, partial [Vulcanococcus sp.]
MGGVGSLKARGDTRVAVQRVLLVALAVNVSVSLLKLVLGLLTGSLAVLADAMHSATDGLSSLMGLITNNLSDPNPDRDHPYGHDKYEALGALAIAGFILVTALEILRTAIERITGGLRPLRLDGQDLLLLLIVLGCNLLLAGYERSEGKRLGNQLLLA